MTEQAGLAASPGLPDCPGPSGFEPFQRESSGALSTSRTRAVTAVVLSLSATGVLAGALWAWIAPSIHAVVAISRAGERVHEYLGSESQNFFVAPFLMLGLLGVMAVVAAVLVWQWREHRGPGMAVALAIGSVAAAAVAAVVGALLVRLHYGALNFDTVTLAGGDHSLTYVRQAPPVFFALQPLQVAATLMAPAAVTSLVYALLAAGSARDDLGAYPAAESEASVSKPASERTPADPHARDDLGGDDR
ncbi:hypothetical protein MSIMFI_04839 [Mycobacterium simulans]|uniref:DUF2567 domain-containing protein n=1 Tax=Mycobacterium simulans TaxID=627089 RepID=UPI001749C966|nr:DUF2567 domain-containing protein [Mycobacterium simulans]SON63309.1 hypothetical protein MSIMFI_04839 [Mycobacterium simulans]